MKNYDVYPKLRTFEEVPEGELRWDACIEALQDDYTLSFRDVCRILKSDRTWVSRYIRPNCQHIYLSPGVGTANYIQLAANRLDKEIKESIWFNTSDFENLIKSSIISCSRQVINIPIEWLIKDDLIYEFRRDYGEILSELHTTCSLGEYRKLIKKKKDLIDDSLNKNGKIVYENLPSKYKRSNTPTIPIDVPKFDMEELVAVHDLKDYGDSEEDIYRNLFTAGACRMEIQISDQKGNKSKKIYYLYISDKIDFGSTVERLPIAYEDYLKFWG